MKLYVCAVVVLVVLVVLVMVVVGVGVGVGGVVGVAVVVVGAPRFITCPAVRTNGPTYPHSVGGQTATPYYPTAHARAPPGTTILHSHATRSSS